MADASVRAGAPRNWAEVLTSAIRFTLGAVILACMLLVPPAARGAVRI